MSKESWLARLAIVLAAGAVVVLVVFAGPHSISLIGFAAAGICVTVACVYWFLARRGVVRWTALTFAVLAPVAVAAIFATRGVLWVAIAVIAMLLAAAAVGKAAMGPPGAEPAAEREAERPRRAFLIMNPRSGGGKVGKFGLRQKAESLGAEVAMLDGPSHVDVAAIAERAVADGADLLGVAGGDGTQALVAGIAAAHDLPFLCISAGTRNHFAMDLGLDRDDPVACLDALSDGIERRIDLGFIGDRTFVNNASFGVYAEIVQSPAYRDDKRGTTLRMLPDLLKGGSDQHKLEAYVGEMKIEAPQAVLVSNNAYEMTDIAGLGRRDRLDRAELGVIAIKVDNAAEAIGLVRAGRGAGLIAASSRAVTVDSPKAEIPVGIDGETVLMPTPVRCSIQPGALRVVVPKDRPGVPAARAPLSLTRLGHLAVFGSGLCSYDGLMNTPNVRQEAPGGRPSGSAQRTAIVTVDDDPGVSRAVARDLRRRYGEQHRIVRAESGADALEALSQMKLRGEQTAVILADYRMPEMNGIEFLERAMDIYPGARRALLTAYADTGAAIDAINVVDLDYYLLKPWDPPEEKLYPVVDALLDAWLSSDHRPVPELKVVGHRWSARSSQVREFLARNQVPYRWFAADEPEGRRLLEAAQADDRTLPVVITADGDVLIEPSESALADRVGLATTPSTDFYDLVVVGGGPAGLGAAVYGASEGLRTLMVERLATGGQAGQSSRIENYLGFPDGVSGAQLTSRARRQAAKFGAEILTTREVVGLEAKGSARTVTFSDGTAVNAHTVILATGVSYRQLGVPGLTELTGTGVFYGSALTEATGCADHDVFIVGGANSAGQAAVYLSKTARSVTMLVRGPSLRKSMSYYLIQQIEAIPNIKVRVCTEVIGAEGDGHLERLTLRDDNTGTTETIDAHWLFVFIGAQPLTDWLDDAVQRDDRGFILTGPDLPLAGTRPKGWPLDRPPYHLETSVPGVFVAGDVRAESAKRVASAVGEGAMAVMLVHRYLEKL